MFQNFVIVLKHVFWWQLVEAELKQTTASLIKIYKNNIKLHKTLNIHWSYLIIPYLLASKCINNFTTVKDG